MNRHCVSVCVYTCRNSNEETQYTSVKYITILCKYSKSKLCMAYLNYFEIWVSFMLDKMSKSICALSHN